MSILSLNNEVTLNFANDIPLSLAISAHSGTSFTPEKRGASEVSGYSAELESVYNTLKENAQKGGTLHLLEEEFARFRGGYRARYTKYLGSKARVMSTMITGPANFPTRRNAKRCDVARKRLEEMIEFKARAMKAAIRNLRPDLRPIMAGDADAIERLEADIAKAERAQETMKAANAAIRKYAKAGDQAQMMALVGLGLSDSQARELLTKDCMGGIGFASYALSNNNANIRRMKERLEQLTKAKATPDSRIEGANGIVVEDCPADNRVRVLFPNKPSADIRTHLKQKGFRWAPSLGVWQAYRNRSSIDYAKQLAA